MTALHRFVVAACSFAAAMITLPTAARAEWFQVSSTHFVVYGEGSEKRMRRFSEQLEQFHSAMVVVTGRDDDPPSPSNRVTVYIVRNQAEVRKLYGGGAAAKYIGGFYRARAGQTIAIVPRVSGEADDFVDPSMFTLLHEYAHHFLIGSSQFPVPRWANEGAAEFFAAANFKDDGAVSVGLPNRQRSYELITAQDVKAGDLLDSDAYEARRGNSTGYDAFYGKSWLLYHYLTLGQTRKGQLTKYIEGLIAGKTSPQAGAEAFGDFAVLEKELDAYMKRPRLFAFTIPAKLITPGQVTLRRLSAGEIAILPAMTRSRNGVDADQAKEVLAEARAVAAQFPADPAVQAALAEAEFDVGNDAEAIAAAEAAIKGDPAQVNAYVQRGYALFRLAEKANDAKSIRAARNAWVDLNHLENNHPLPLIYFYRSYQLRGANPPPLAVQGLKRASELAPFDLGLRMNLAMQQLRDGDRAAARLNLIPIAHNPHGGGLADYAKRMIARIDAQPDWRGQGMDVPVDDEAEVAAQPPA